MLVFTSIAVQSKVFTEAVEIICDEAWHTAVIDLSELNIIGSSEWGMLTWDEILKKEDFKLCGFDLTVFDSKDDIENAYTDIEYIAFFNNRRAPRGRNNLLRYNK